MGRLGAHADSLAPLAGHHAEAALADAARVRPRLPQGQTPLVAGVQLRLASAWQAGCGLRVSDGRAHSRARRPARSPTLQGTTAEGDPYAAHLRIRLLPDSATAVSAQVCVWVSWPRRAARQAAHCRRCCMPAEHLRIVSALLACSASQSPRRPRCRRRARWRRARRSAAARAAPPTGPHAPRCSWRPRSSTAWMPWGWDTRWAGRCRRWSQRCVQGPSGRVGRRSAETDLQKALGGLTQSALERLHSCHPRPGSHARLHGPLRVHRAGVPCAAPPTVPAPPLPCAQPPLQDTLAGCAAVSSGWLGPSTRASFFRLPPTCLPHLQDTLAGYAAVFSLMARVRRAEQLLRGAHAPLAVQPRSTAGLLLRWGLVRGAWWARATHGCCVSASFWGVQGWPGWGCLISRHRVGCRCRPVAQRGGRRPRAPPHAAPARLPPRRAAVRGRPAGLPARPHLGWVRLPPPSAAAADVFHLGSTVPALPADACGNWAARPRPAVATCDPCTLCSVYLKPCRSCGSLAYRPRRRRLAAAAGQAHGVL